MSRIAMYFASGESLYPGAGLLLLAVISPAVLKQRWMLRVRNLLAWVALALMIMASLPFSLVVSLMFLALFVFWFITSNQSSLSQTTINLQMGASILLAISLLILTMLEFSHRKMPRITSNPSDHLVVIGDSISSGIGGEIWGSAHPQAVLRTSARRCRRNERRPASILIRGAAAGGPSSAVFLSSPEVVPVVGSTT